MHLNYFIDTRSYNLYTYRKTKRGGGDGLENKDRLTKVINFRVTDSANKRLKKMSRKMGLGNWMRELVAEKFKGVDDATKQVEVRP